MVRITILSTFIALFLFSLCEASFHTKAIDLISRQRVANICSATKVRPLLECACFFFRTKTIFTADNDAFCTRFFGPDRRSYIAGCRARGLQRTKGSINRNRLFNVLNKTQVLCVEGGAPPPSIQPRIRLSTLEVVRASCSLFCESYGNFCGLVSWSLGRPNNCVSCC